MTTDTEETVASCASPHRGGGATEAGWAPEWRRPSAARRSQPTQRIRHEDALRAEGQCVLGCGRPIDAPRSRRLCRVHRLQKNRYSHAAYWRRRAPCYCLHCQQLIDPRREPRQRKYHRACAEIVQREQAAARQRIQPPTEALKAAHRRAARAYQQRHLAQGLCVFCGRRAEGGRQTCRRHRVRSR